MVGTVKRIKTPVIKYKRKVDTIDNMKIPTTQKINLTNREMQALLNSPDINTNINRVLEFLQLNKSRQYLTIVKNISNFVNGEKSDRFTVNLKDIKDFGVLASRTNIALKKINNNEK